MTKLSESDVDVASMLNLVDMCKESHMMPLAGGLFDQDSLFMHLYEYIGQLRNTREKLDQHQEQANANLAKARAKQR